MELLYTCIMMLMNSEVTKFWLHAYSTRDPAFCLRYYYTVAVWMAGTAKEPLICPKLVKLVLSPSTCSYSQFTSMCLDRQVPLVRGLLCMQSIPSQAKANRSCRSGFKLPSSCPHFSHKECFWCMSPLLGYRLTPECANLSQFVIEEVQNTNSQ